ncbi:UvrD-helicase domain-containing protein [uncultured Desulfosarcina sp.]|uniref:UvrD-helicase domain-containing protein n=1 Tax=uncultured Desulfosarcina sp. TaxID=218289 RepID=UPI0029C675C9|nr:UvrD-helicase domain-containing protein [uncultured Desulfosarcina sp.]
MMFAPIDNPNQVDISRHALVEASAGTGKTYTIENLVVRLLCEEADTRLENILLVTFTEKATGELKLRIRQKIEATLDNEVDLSDAVRSKLGETLDAFDNATITTIHGFCHTLLKDFPFETGSLFRQEIVDDGPLLTKLLKARMRSTWPERYGRYLELLMGLADFSADPDRFIRNVVTLAQRLSHNFKREILIPDPADLDVENLWERCRKTVLELKALVAGPPDLASGYERLNINARTKAAIVRDLVTPLQHVMARVDDDDWRPMEIQPIVDTLGVRHSSGKRNVDRLVPEKWLKAGENLGDCPNLIPVCDRLDRLVDLFGRMAHVLTLESVTRLQQDAKAMKARQGWISYQDMISRVADFLSDKGAEEGIRNIRRRFPVAFVDEFQDTDELQWQIFRTLFLETCDNADHCRLFLIGDPKQAIYAFRGADVFTYLDARRRMKNLTGQGQANLYRLSVNWRSCPPLIDAYNRIFCQNDWFGDSDGDQPYAIDYSPSDPPPSDHPSAVAVDDRSSRPAFNVMDLQAARGQVAAKTILAEFICREIEYLVGAGGIRMAAGLQEKRRLNYGDIAILVRSRPEFSLLEPMLLAAGIPYTYYRQPGLFQCREAYWLSMVLHAVAQPLQPSIAKLALLTPFFDVDAHCLESLPELPPDHACQRLLMRWHAQAQNRRWGALFQSMMEDSGLVLRRCTDPGWERSQTNFRQLFDTLENAAYLQNLEPDGVVALLDALRLSRVDIGADADIHRIEDEADKVQILTMHVAKGLEFPVVFIAGGLTVRSENSVNGYHQVDSNDPDQGCRKVIDLTGETGREQAEKEQQDENKRLYYVALTRSRLKLYVPYFPDDRNYGWIGPVSRFVAPSIASAWNNGDFDPEGWHRIEQDDAPPPIPDGRKNDAGDKAHRLPSEALLPNQADYRSRKISLESFSSIGHRLNRGRTPFGPPSFFSLEESAQREMDEPADRFPVEAAISDTTDELPGGTRMGSMFHQIFEQVDFDRVLEGPEDILKLETVRQVVASALSAYRIDSSWTPRIAAMVAKVLREPIDLDGTSLVLGGLAPERRRHEIEFFFPLAKSLSRISEVPGCEVKTEACGEMVLRGFIDLVFEHDGRYYIADWKSNRLADGYGQDAMAREIEAAGYALQYRLYTIATLRWLKRMLGDGFDPQHHFGGALYIFIRGVGSGGKNGMFHVPAQELLPLETLQATVEKQVGGLQW